MARQITAKGGPLDGKEFLVHETAERLDEHPGVKGGHYKVNDKTATWQPDAKLKPAAPKPSKPTASKSAALKPATDAATSAPSTPPE
jgi:hypothetical protein